MRQVEATNLAKRLDRERRARLEAESIAETTLRDLYAKQRALEDEIAGRQLVERQFRQAQKMEAVGRLAGGIAHDFNNILTVILGTSDIILTECEIGDDVREWTTEIRKTAERAALLTRQLLAFSRKQVVAPVVLNLSKVIADVEGMLRRLIGADIALSLELDPALSPIAADPGQIEQVLMNLVVNARDAMPSGGRLRIGTRDEVLDRPIERDGVGMEPGRYVALAVSDTGCGMDAETKGQLFEPFFTTKEVGKGTGLGLATVYGIVKQAGGFVFADSAPGEGAVFTVYLPVTVGESQPVAVESVAALAPAGGTETVMLIEDEIGVASLARLILRTRGYMVIEVHTAEAALDQCRTHQGPIDLILTDVILPGTNGRILSDRLRAERPWARVLFMSGYPAEAIAHHGVLDPGVMLLNKPFTPVELARKVREALDAGPLGDCR